MPGTIAWPLVGRDDELRAAVDAIGASPAACVVLTGRPGVGKSRLANEVLAVLEAGGAVVERVVASESAASIPFGAFAPLLPLTEPMADTRAGFVARLAAVIQRRGEGKPVVLAIDDAHNLDDASATLVHQLVELRSAAVLLTVRAGEPLPPGLALLAPHERHVELHPLTRPQVEELVAITLDAPADDALLEHLWVTSQGNPLFLREMLAGGRDAGLLRLVNGSWQLGNRRSTPPRLMELVESRIGRLDEPAIRALEFVAVAERIGHDSLIELIGADVVTTLEDLDLVRTHAEQRRRPVRLAHPIYSEVLQARMPARRIRSVRTQLADHLRATGARRQGDALRVATLQLDSGTTPELPVLEAATRDALLAYDLDLAERIAAAGTEAGAGPVMVRALGEILRWQGRPERAIEVLSTIEPATLDDEQRSFHAQTIAECLFRSLGRHDEADALLASAAAAVSDPLHRGELEATRLLYQALAGNVSVAIDGLLHQAMTGDQSRVTLTAGTGVAPALIMAGRVDDAIAVAERVYPLALAIGVQPMLADPAIHVVSRCMALAESGRLAEAQTPSEVGHEISLSLGFVVGRAWFAMLLGRCALGAGRLQEAIRRFQEGAACFEQLAEPAVQRWSLAGVAQAAAAAGDTELAQDALDEVDQVGPTAMRLADVEIERARAWVEAARGELTRARDRCAEAADHARQRGHHGLEASALHDLVRFGGARDGRRRLAELAEGGQGPLIAIRADHATAAADDDGEALDLCSTRFEELGALLYAAEAAAQAAAAHERHRHRRSARVSTERAARLASACDGARTPALVSARPAPDERAG